MSQSVERNGAAMILSSQPLAIIIPSRNALLHLHLIVSTKSTQSRSNGVLGAGFARVTGPTRQADRTSYRRWIHNSDCGEPRPDLLEALEGLLHVIGHVVHLVSQMETLVRDERLLPGARENGVGQVPR